MDNQTAALIRKLRQEVADLQEKIGITKIQGDIPASLPGQYSGKPIPHTESVEIDIEKNTNAQQGNITLAADGPFLAQRIHFAFRPTAGNYSGVWRPLSSYEDQAGSTMNDAINFYWEYSVSGSYRQRQNNPIPSSCLTEMGRGNGAWDFYVQDVFNPTATITIKITPTNTPDNAGVMWVGFHGCYVLD